ncbi:hypothetical protein Poli38472_011458 [Pythium oligandrum]|uniref:TM7S3/TM198-like domain-containing protein n=1 Tax=Pythium oligandrum TaxID=41045 RepID=A0A8K1CKE0_PYTOL|nr:hypothetical protein Poli38472_011458 [Pythium oligandrum]|eukprot:TMW64578.1 hypothetical protein Poli38472_011458 [Pythium oligandrum]
MEKKQSVMLPLLLAVCVAQVVAPATVLHSTTKLQVAPGIAAVLAIFLGLFVCFYGYKLLRPAIFLCGFVTGGLLVALIIQYAFASMAWMATASWIGFLVAGGITGCLALWLYNVGLFLVGALSGILLAFMLNTSFGYRIYPSQPDVMLVIMVVFFGILFGFLASMVEKPVVILATSFIGATGFVWGVGYFIGKYPSGADLKRFRWKNPSGDWIYTIPKAWWAYLVVTLLLFLAGVVVQYHSIFLDLDRSKMNDARRVYATLITSDAYVMGVEALAYSLFKANARYPLLVLHTPQVTSACCEKLARFFQPLQAKLPISLRCVPEIGIPERTEHVHVAGWVNSGYSKLNIFALEEFEKIVYIDADALVLQNVDELFDRSSSFAAAPDVFPPDRFNAGVLVIQPNTDLFEALVAKATVLPSYDGGDTGFLNAFFPDWFHSDPASRLPFGYNAQRTMYWLVNAKNPGYWQAIQPLKILHYSSNPKPWEAPDRKGDLEMLWWQVYTESRCLGFLPGF